MQEKPFIPLSEANYAVEAIGRLMPDNLVRRQSVAVLQGNPSDDIQPLCAVLQEGLADRWGEVEVAAWALGRSGLAGEERERAGVLLMDTLEGRRRPKTTIGMLGKGFIRSLLPALGCVIVSAAAFGFRPDSPEEFFGLLFFYAMVLAATFSPSSWFWRKGRQNAIRAVSAQALGHLKMPESVGGLAGALYQGNPAVRRAAADALKEALPEVTDSHYGLFSTQAMENLGRALLHDDSQLVLLVLDALGKIGTSAAIPHVQRVWESARTTRVRDTAADVIKILESRREQERHSQRLLRPSSSPTAGPDALLRPARSSGDPDTETLLRPTNGAA